MCWCEMVADAIVGIDNRAQLQMHILLQYCSQTGVWGVDFMICICSFLHTTKHQESHVLSAVLSLHISSPSVDCSGCCESAE